MSDSLDQTAGQATAPARALDQVKVFRYVTAPEAPTYRSIVEVFFRARRSFRIALKPAQLAEDLLGLDDRHRLAEPLGEESLERHLAQLVEWGVLTRSHDAAAVARIEDFYRKRHVYHLSAAGEEAHRAVARVEATLGRTGALQTSMLAKVRDTLAGLVEQAGDGAADPERCFGLLHDLFSAFESLTQEAERFLALLGEQVQLETTAAERFVARKQAVVAYLSRFIAHLSQLAEEISVQIAALRGEPAQGLIGAAVRAADLPPQLDGGDVEARWRRERQEAFSGLVGWFVGDPGRRPTVEHLRSVALQAVTELIRSLSRINERRGQRADRAADHRALARWFAACLDDQAAHRLWQVAFGLRPARHLQVPQEDPELAPPSSSWWAAPPVDVPVRLRTHGRLHAAGRPAPARDRSAERSWIAARLAKRREDRRRALDRLADRGPVRLSSLAALRADELEVLLELLDLALSAPTRADGERRADSSDGAVSIGVRPVDGVGGWAEIEVPGGRLRCADMTIEIARRAAGRNAPGLGITG